ncbi:MAG: serine hydroxymethyltransferase [Christensenellaceae bacterium]|jgi:glycine hydroxymethyltransferase|nr:serine hydroxymethyltransferase [Christensenellaceae bacterium]
MIQSLIKREQKRQDTKINMIASENMVSKNVLKAMGSCFTNKYAEGYPSARYYAGNEIVDCVEEYACDLAKKLFLCEHANVQPHSGSQANQAAYMAILKPGDTILSMSLDAGGHLTHGASVSQAGQIYKIVQYGLDANGVIDYAGIEKLAKSTKPKLIVAGGSAYSLVIDFERISKIAKSVEAYFMVDMAHFAGLVAAGFYPNPCKFADIVTSTTHKTLRGPRGGIILCREELAKAVDKAVFPGVQGGPLVHIIAAKAVCFEEALQPTFKTYIKNVIDNTAYLCKKLQESGIKMICNGTQTHLFLIDLTDTDKTGAQVSQDLEDKFGIIVNKNKIFNDKRSAKETSGIRVGCAFITNNKKVDKNVLEEIADCFKTVILGTSAPKIKLLKKVFK